MYSVAFSNNTIVLRSVNMTANEIKQLSILACKVRMGIIDKATKDVVWNDVQVGTGQTSENWNRKEGSTVSLNVYTNCDKVELVLNGKKIAEKENPNDRHTRNKLKFDDIKYDGEFTYEADNFLKGFDNDYFPKAVEFMVQTARHLISKTTL